MPMAADDIVELLRAGIPDAKVEITDLRGAGVGRSKSRLGGVPEAAQCAPNLAVTLNLDLPAHVVANTGSPTLDSSRVYSVTPPTSASMSGMLGMYALNVAVGFPGDATPSFGATTTATLVLRSACSVFHEPVSLPSV